MSNPTSCSITNNLLQIENINGGNTVSAGAEISFALQNMNNPYSVEDVGSFEINTYEIYESQRYKIDAGTASNVYTAIPNRITDGLSLTASSYETNFYPSTYTVTFIPASTIPSGGILKITVPISSVEIFSESQTEQDVFITLGNGSPFAADVSAEKSTGIIQINNAFLSGWDKS